MTEKENEKLKLVLITGMSGSGMTVALQSFEDMGYFTVHRFLSAIFISVTHGY